MKHRTLGLVCAAVMLAGCGDDDGGSPSATVSSGSTGTGSPTSDGPAPSSSGTPTPKADLGVEPAMGCAAFCEASRDCLGASETDCLLSCTAEAEEQEAVSGDCADGFFKARACATELSCDDFAQYSAGQEEYPCSEQDADWRLACALGDDPPSMACDAFCTVLADCGLGEDSACAASCAETAAADEDVGTQCSDARNEQLSCAASLSCEALEAWLLADPGAACEGENEAVAEDCIGDP